VPASQPASRDALFGVLGRLIPRHQEPGRTEPELAGEPVSEIEAEQIAGRFGRSNGA
jgi:hypothetical protein